MRSPFVVFVVAPFFLTVVVTWLLMIGLGVTHAQILPAVIPAGYGVLFFPCMLFTFLSYYCAVVKEILS